MDQCVSFVDANMKLAMMGIPSKDLSITQIACGLNFCMALSFNYRVFAWGDNQFGNLGTGDFKMREVPELVLIDGNRGKDWKICQLACGSNHAAAVSITGKLYTWGSGSSGQLGLGNTFNQNLPQMVQGDLKEKRITHVSCGGNHTISITNEGYAYSWGMNRNGQLGQGDEDARIAPTKINRLQNYFIMNVVCGMNNSFLFTQVGKIFACGNNTYNKTGFDSTTLALSSLNRKNYNVPTPLETSFIKGADKQKLKDVYIYQIAASTHFTYALSNRGHLTTWGLKVQGCLSRRIDNFILQRVSDEDRMQTNMLIPSSVTVRTSQGVLKHFYPIQNGNLYRASGKDFISSEIVDIQLGTFHTMGLTNAGEIYVWGSNQMGQHGCANHEIREQYANHADKFISNISPEISPETLPTVVSFFNIQENRRITFIAAGSEYCVAIENKRLVYAWGRNNEGQLGIGKLQMSVETPQMVLGLQGNLMKSISCGENHTLFLTDTGRVYSCGSPKDGKLGLGQRSNTQLQPQLIETISKVAQIACGSSHSMALGYDSFFGSENEDDDDFNSRSGAQQMVIYTWGSGWESKLGHGDRENLAEPTKIQTNFQFKSISAGYHHSAALTQEDQLVVWGPYRYFGHIRPDESVKDKKAATSNQFEYSEFMKPTLHPKITEKIRFVSLGDKLSIIVTKKDNKIIQFGIFESDLREQRKVQVSEQAIEKYISRLPAEENEVPVNEINMINVSKDHIALLGKNQVYTWGFDNLTGRLGQGYSFLDRSENTIEQIDDHNQQFVAVQQQIDLSSKSRKPENCQYINRYLQEQLVLFKKKQILNKEESRNNPNDSQSDDEEDEDDQSVEGDARNKKDQKQGPQVSIRSSVFNQSEVQLKRTASDSQKSPQNPGQRKTVKHQSTFIKSGQYQKIKEVKLSAEEVYQQFFLQPNIIKSTYEKFIAKDSPDLHSILHEPFGLLNEERILYLYDKVSSIQSEVFLRYQRCHDYMNHNVLYKKATMSETLKRISSEPFSIRFDKASPQIPPEVQSFSSNKFYYKKIFTLLQIHPCYLIKMYQKKIDEDLFIELVKETFGDLENNIRKQRLYTELCRKILLLDLRGLKDIKGSINLTGEKGNSISYVFVKLILHFYQSLSENIRLNRIFRLRMKRTLEDMVSSNSSRFSNSQGAGLFVLEKAQLDSDSFLKTEDQLKEMMDKNQAALKDYLLLFFKDFDFSPGISTSAKSLLSDKIKELLLFAQELILSKKPTEVVENIQNCIMSILFSSILEKCESLSNEGDKLSVNYQWIIKGMKMYINLEDKHKKKPDINNFIEFVKSQDEERARIYKRFFGKTTTKKSSASSSFEMISDIYSHSLEKSDDVIFVKLSTIEKLTKFLSKTNIQFNPKEAEDFFLACCKQIRQNDINSNSSSSNQQQQQQEKVKIKLQTRQLYYAQNQIMKKCNDCETILQKDFLRSTDKDLKDQFQTFNPQSLEACGIRVITLISKPTYDELFSGKISSQTLIQKFAGKLMKQRTGLNNVSSLHGFHRAFEQSYQLEYSNISLLEKLIIPSDLKKEVLKKLKSKIDSQIKTAVKYYNKMETLFRIYFNIKTVVDSYLSQINDIKAQQFRILTNCYYGLANRELEKVIERDPIAITSKISGSIHGKNMSTFLYENIDAFSNKDLTTLNTKITENRISEHFIRLNMFGEYSLNSLKTKNVIRDIHDDTVGILSSYFPNSKTVRTKKDIEKCLFYIFNDFGGKSINVDVVYKGGEFSLMTILCGAKNIQDIRIGQFQIDKDDVLLMRKNRIRIDLSRAEKEFGFTTFNIKGLLKLIDKMEDHYSVYEYIYTSNNCSV